MITKKGATKNKAMPLVDEISRIPVIPLSWRRCVAHGIGDVDDERKDGHDDEFLERTGIHQLGRTSLTDRLTFLRAGDFLPPFG